MSGSEGEGEGLCAEIVQKDLFQRELELVRRENELLKKEVELKRIVDQAELNNNT